MQLRIHARRKKKVNIVLGLCFVAQSCTNNFEDPYSLHINCYRFVRIILNFNYTEQAVSSASFLFFHQLCFTYTNISMQSNTVVNSWACVD